MRRLTCLLASCACLLLAPAVPAQTDVDKASQAVTASVIRSHIEFLASDALEGRGAGTRGGDIAARYIAAQYIRLGLQPAGDGGSYFFKVPLVSFTPEPTLSLGGTALAYPKDFVLNPMRWDSVASVDAPLVFAGYGIVAPEYDWNDYAGIDVKGKIVAVMVNDPGLHDPAIFKGKVLTYYGRWTYKYEEAARQGAAGVLLIHTEESATYPWGTVEGSYSGRQVRLETRADLAPGGGLGAARRHGARLHGRRRRPRPVHGPGRQEGVRRPPSSRSGWPPRVRAPMTRTATYNVLGRLPGQRPARLRRRSSWSGRTTTISASAPPVDGDSIYNGARDNAAGVGEMLAIAEAMSRANLSGKRSILFTAFGGEESGLLGSQAMIDRPFMPLRNVAAMINFDGANLFGRTRDVSASGSDQSSLLGAMQAAARLEGLQVSEDSSARCAAPSSGRTTSPSPGPASPRSRSSRATITWVGRRITPRKSQAEYTSQAVSPPAGRVRAWYSPSMAPSRRPGSGSGP